MEDKKDGVSWSFRTPWSFELSEMMLVMSPLLVLVLICKEMGWSLYLPWLMLLPMRMVSPLMAPLPGPHPKLGSCLFWASGTSVSSSIRDHQRHKRSITNLRIWSWINIKRIHGCLVWLCRCEKSTRSSEPTLMELVVPGSAESHSRDHLLNRWFEMLNVQNRLQGSWATEAGARSYI